MMTIGSFLAQFLLGWLVITVAIYIPGRLFYRCLRLNLLSLEAFTLSLVSGMALLVLVYRGLLQLFGPFSLWFYVAGCVITEGYFFWNDYRRREQGYTDQDAPEPEPLWHHWPLGLLMLAGMAVQSRYSFWTGWITPQGVDILAWHGHDSTWHIFNIFQFTHTFPAQMPGFAGWGLRNYHYFSDLLWGALAGLGNLNPWHCYFRLAPLLYSGGLTLTVFIAAREWAGNRRTAYLAVGITWFCSSLGYVLPLLFGGDRYFLWETIFWIQSPLTNVFNPGVAASFVVLMMGVWALVKWINRHHWVYLLVLALCWGVLPGFKVYAGLLAMAGLLAAGLVWLVLYRGGKMLTPFLLVLPLFLLVFLTSNLNAPGLIRWLPGFNLGAMLVAPDRMGLMPAAQLKILYVEHPGLVVLIMAVLTLVFLIGNLGVRALALWPMLKTVRNLRQADPLMIWLTTVVAAAWAIPVLFVQTGTPWNTIQFFYYAMLLTALPAAKQFWDWVDAWDHRWRIAALVCVFAVGMPAMIQSLWRVDFKAHMHSKFLEGMLWLKANAKSGDVILRPLPKNLRTEAGYQQWKRGQDRGRMTSMHVWKNEAQAISNSLNAQTAPALAGAQAAGTTPVAQAVNTLIATPQVLTTGVAAKIGRGLPVAATRWPVWQEDDTALVAALTQVNTYLEDTINSQIMGYPIEARVEGTRRFYQSDTIIDAREFLETERINYVILYPGMTLPFDPAGIPLKLQFVNDEISIYKRVEPMRW